MAKPKAVEPLFYPDEAKQVLEGLQEAVDVLCIARDREHEPIAKGMLNGLLAIARCAEVAVERIAARETSPFNDPARDQTFEKYDK